MDAVPLVLGSVEASVAMPLPDYDEMRTRQAQRLKAFGQELFPGMKATRLVEEGEPGRVLSEAIKRHGTDLVMLPTH